MRSVTGSGEELEESTCFENENKTKKQLIYEYNNNNNKRDAAKAKASFLFFFFKEENRKFCANSKTGHAGGQKK